MGRVYPPAPPVPDCRVCEGSGETAHGARCVCTYNRDRALEARAPAPEPVGTRRYLAGLPIKMTAKGWRWI